MYDCLSMYSIIGGKYVHTSNIFHQLKVFASVASTVENMEDQVGKYGNDCEQT